MLYADFLFEYQSGRDTLEQFACSIILAIIKNELASNNDKTHWQYLNEREELPGAGKADVSSSVAGSTHIRL
jgi:hypothetical protein